MMAAPRLDLPSLVDVWAAATPLAPAIFAGDRTLGFAALAAESRQVAGGLQALGVAPGDRVAIWMPNAPAWLATLFACARVGAVAVAVNTRFRSAEIGDILARSGAKVLVAWAGLPQVDVAAILSAIAPDALARLETVVVYREDDSSAAIGIDRSAVAYEALAGHAPLAREVGTADSTALIFTTSGTTSLPKLVLHTQASLTRHAHDVAAAFGTARTDHVELLSLPLCGTFGLTQALATLAGGRPMVMQRMFDAAEAAALIARHSVTDLAGTDEMAARLLDAVGNTPLATLRCIRFASFGTAIPDLPATAHRHGIALAAPWGASEMQAFFALPSPDASEDARILAGGNPVSPLAAFRIVDPETGATLPPGEAGALEVAGPSRMHEYFGDPAATVAALTADGYLRMNDLAVGRADGGFTFLMRLGDAMRLGGYLVAPAEIEDCLQSHPSVAAAQIVAVETAKGRRAIGFVVLRPGMAFDEALLRAHCAATLAPFKVPLRILALAAFPTVASANGEKIRREVLREMAAAAVAL
jgi:fatty-acyl-CoA synthase